MSIKVTVANSLQAEMLAQKLIGIDGIDGIEICVKPPCAINESISRNKYNVYKEVVYGGKTFVILGDGVPADDGGRDYPSTSAHVDYCEAWLGQENMTEFLNGEQWKEVEAILRSES